MTHSLSDIDWFEWNDVRCTDYGIHVLAQPSIISANERTSTITIPGMSGQLTYLEGDNIHDPISLSVTCVIDTPYEDDDETYMPVIDKICGWLVGKGTVRFANRQNGYYVGRITNQISFEQVVRGNLHRAFSVQFDVDPYLYLDSGNDEITVTDDSVWLTNEGNISSLPLIKLTGTGEGSIMIGDNTMLIESFDDIDYIMLDCKAKIAYTGESGSTDDPLTLVTSRVTGEWMSIAAGGAYVTLSGDITSAVITPRWRVR